MRQKGEAIRLGQLEWRVRPLTLAQVQAIEPLLMASGDARSGNVAAAIAILRVALSRDHADAAADLENVEAGASEIAAAMAGVLRLGGFLPSGNGGSTPLGEASAGEAPAL